MLMTEPDIADMVGLNVEVYRNLHRNCYSVRAHGSVIGYVSDVTLLDPRFVVQPAGRDRVRLTGHKNVHAMVRGIVLPGAARRVPETATEVRYDPYRFDTFVTTAGDSVTTAARVTLTQDFRMYADQPV